VATAEPKQRLKRLFSISHLLKKLRANRGFFISPSGLNVCDAFRAGLGKCFSTMLEQLVVNRFVV